MGCGNGGGVPVGGTWSIWPCGWLQQARNTRGGGVLLPELTRSLRFGLLTLCFVCLPAARARGDLC